ncbi:uncharacterized protein LOC108709956 [Xenopus laevis]|uniref:Uncharacterized protein LOC108709956 n=1 Tax=Xenopus laevis TaxID=8355 RepID=A0A8J0UQ44_XENLA|nr:uncharacterized protein LOC108709956 [Xenopus laevis]
MPRVPPKHWRHVEVPTPQPGEVGTPPGHASFWTLWAERSVKVWKGNSRTQTGEHHRGQRHNPRTVTRTRTLILNSPRKRVRFQIALEPHKLKNTELPGAPSHQP